MFQAIANAMIEENRLHKIAPCDIPISAKYNELGQPALFAVVMPADLIAQFNRRIWELRQ
jgi:hypothetical protein